ncbi:MAG: hypothetical protein OXS47_12255 [Chloroflexota bacterium]|nr:hypothetical protein [Chloroflexota bacterium]
MTTLVALASKDVLVMGTDSLGTVPRPLVDPSDLLAYFDDTNGYRLKLDGQGKPLLDDFGKIMDQAQQVPYNQLGNVTKLFDLYPLPMGVMYTGITSIGSRTIGKMIAAFKEKDAAFASPDPSSNYTVQSLGTRLLEFLHSYYASEYSNPDGRPDLELLLGGYDHLGYLPDLYRIDIRENTITKEFDSEEYPFGVAFAGQADWIHRIVYGIDFKNWLLLSQKNYEILQNYRTKIVALLAEAKVDFEVPEPDAFGEELDLFRELRLQSLEADWSEFSEQNAIDCVDFFLDIMIRSQGVSSQLPTVGGNTHIAVIQKQGFQFVSREEWTHRDHSVRIPGVQQ